MDATLIYFLKTNLALVFFYAFYRLLASKDTFFGIRRMLLLLFWIVAFFYPLAENWTWVQHSTPAVVNNVIQVYSSVLPEVLVQPESVSSPTVTPSNVIVISDGSAATVRAFFVETAVVR